MSTETETLDRSTLAGRVRAAGGGGLPESVITLVQANEQKRRAIQADQRYSKPYRDEQVAALDREEEAAIYAARDADVAAAAKAVQARKAQLLAELRSQFSHSAPAATETMSEQVERHHRSTRDTVGLLPDLIAAQASDDPSDLLDQLEEAIQAQQHTRIRKLAPVVISRLGALAQDEHDGARAAWMAARTLYANHKKANPSVNARLKAVEEELRTVAALHERQYRRALEFFRVGQSKQGMTL